MFIVPIRTVSVNFRCKPFPYNAESFSLLYYINKKTHLTRCDLVCFADPRFKSATSGFTKKLFCLPRPQWNVPALYFADSSIKSACRFSLTRCDLVCFAGPHFKSTTSGFTRANSFSCRGLNGMCPLYILQTARSNLLADFP